MQPAQNKKNKKGQANRGAGGGKHRRGERQEGTAEQAVKEGRENFSGRGGKEIRDEPDAGQAGGVAHQPEGHAGQRAGKEDTPLPVAQHERLGAFDVFIRDKAQDETLPDAAGEKEGGSGSDDGASPGKQKAGHEAEAAAVHDGEKRCRNGEHKRRKKHETAGKRQGKPPPGGRKGMQSQ